MKKKVFALLFAVVLCISSVLPVMAVSSNARLADDAGLLSGDEYSYILDTLNEISERQDFDVVIHTCFGDSGYDIVDYADCYFDDNFGTNNDGAILVIDSFNNKWSISTSGRGVDNISNDKCDEIGEDIAEYLKEGDYYNAMLIFAEFCDNNCNGSGYNWFFGIVFSLVAGFGIALIVVFVLKGQLKSVRRQPAAKDYLVPGSMNVTSSRDIFLYRNVTKRAKPKDNSSSHTSSSGGRHGGSSGSF